jgi:hypothetical protein
VPRRGYQSIGGIDPLTNNAKEFYIADSKIEHLLKYGPTSRYYGILSAGQVLKNPKIVFKGLKRDGKENALCYVGKPSRFGENWHAPGPSGMVFLVCITDHDVVFEWRWEKEDKAAPNMPEDCARRFETTIWTSSNT